MVLFAFHLRISQHGVLVLSDLDPHRYFRPHGLCSCHLCLCPFSLGPDMIANDNFICIFVDFFFLVKNPSLCFLKQTESFQTKIKSLVLNAHCSSSCKTLKDHCAYLPLLEYGCNQLPASSIFSALSLSFCFWLNTLYSASQPCPATS